MIIELALLLSIIYAIIIIILYNKDTTKKKWKKSNTRPTLNYDELSKKCGTGDIILFRNPYNMYYVDTFCGDEFSHIGIICKTNDEKLLEKLSPTDKATDDLYIVEITDNDNAFNFLEGDKRLTKSYQCSPLKKKLENVPQMYYCWRELSPRLNIEEFVEVIYKYKNSRHVGKYLTDFCKEAIKHFTLFPAKIEKLACNKYIITQCAAFVVSVYEELGIMSKKINPIHCRPDSFIRITNPKEYKKTNSDIQFIGHELLEPYKITVNNCK